jgi:hypothetical protein
MCQDGLSIYVTPVFIVILPPERMKFVVEFGETRPMEVAAAVCERKGGGDLVQLQRGESFDPSILEWVSGDRFVKLLITGVGAVNRLKREQFDGVGGQVGGMLFLLFAWFVNMFQFVRRTLQCGCNMSRASVCKLQFVNNSAGRIGSDGMPGKHDVSD